MLDAEVVLRSVKIGKHYIFDKETNLGYEVIRNESNEIVNFKEAFKLHKVNSDEYTFDIISKSVAYGVLSKAIYIANRENGKM